MALHKNLIANFFGSFWTALISLAFIPFYIDFMGIEAFGLIGFYASLLMIVSIFDMGLSQSMNREMARLSERSESSRQLADTARTLEVIYYIVATLIFLVICSSASLIAQYWLRPEKLTTHEVQVALWLIALVIGFRWPIALYMGGLNGLQKQLQVNYLLIFFSTLQGGGALLVLSFTPTITAFFCWQALSTFIQLLCFRFTLWNCFSFKGKSAFRVEILRNIWRFAAGVSGISILAVVLTQLDKIILSNLLPLKDFGYYTFAVTIAAVIYKIIGPVFTAFYPKFTELISNNQEKQLIKVFHLGCQVMALAVLPLSFTLVFFNEALLSVWTGNSDLVQNSSLLLSLLVIGNALNSLVNIPYALQLAYGKTRPAFFVNLLSVIIFAPAIYFSTKHYGATGAAFTWILLNVGYLLAGSLITFKYFLMDEKWRWYKNDVVWPLFVSMILGVMVYILMPINISSYMYTFLIIIFFFILSVSVLVVLNILRPLVVKKMGFISKYFQVKNG